MRRLNILRSFQVGDGAADLQDAAVGAGAESQLVDRDFEKFFRFRFHGAIFLDVSRPHLRVGVEISFVKARALDLPSPLCQDEHQASSLAYFIIAAHIQNVIGSDLAGQVDGSLER
jgi:hypothetical protein